LKVVDVGKKSLGDIFGGEADSSDSKES